MPHQARNLSNTLADGLGGPRGFGENVVGRNDDGSTQAIDITPVFEGPLNFFGQQEDSFFLNNNGSITFEEPRSTFTPNTITAENGNPEITPYFADVDTGGPLLEQGSEEPDNLTPTPGGNSTGSNLVYYDLNEQHNTFTATWDDVGYYSENTDRLNAFQLQLIGQGGGDFDIVFRYEDINWTTGDASGGQNGLGGEMARAGFTAGDGENFFELPQSGDQQAMLSLDETTGNTGQTGGYRFEVRSGQTELVPTLTTSDIAVEEGNSGTTNTTFSVRLLQSPDETVTVDYATQGGTATAGEDYEPHSGTLTFEPGQTEQTIDIPVSGDERIEPNEDVVLELSNPSNGEFPFSSNTFSRRLTIQDDDGPVANSSTRANNWGDPHLVIFDGADYDFQAVGEFIYAQSDSTNFEVQARTQPLEGNENVSINTAVATQLGGQRVGLYANREQPLVIGDTPTELADGESVSVGNGEVFRNGNRYTIVHAGEDGEVNDGDSQVVGTVRGDRIDLEVYAADSQEGSLSGLLGNFNNNPDDDLALRDGTQLERPVPFERLYGEYANSWRIAQDESLFSYQGGDTTETFTNRELPRESLMVEGLSEQERQEAEQAVEQAGITNPNLREAAILDVALSGDESFIQGAAEAQVSQQSATESPEGTTFSLDVDGNGNTSALTDGILSLRYLFGFEGQTLTSGALGQGAGRGEAAQITNFLNEAGSALDVDGNGNTSALTDGILLVRYLFGFEGQALTQGAIGEGPPAAARRPLRTTYSNSSPPGEAACKPKIFRRKSQN